VVASTDETPEPTALILSKPAIAPVDGLAQSLPASASPPGIVPKAGSAFEVYATSGTKPIVGFAAGVSYKADDSEEGEVGKEEKSFADILSEKEEAAEEETENLPQELTEVEGLTSP
jgi:hypothetical protein